MIAVTIAFPGKPGAFGKTHVVYVSTTGDRLLERSLCGLETDYRTDGAAKVECRKCLAKMKQGRLW